MNIGLQFAGFITPAPTRLTNACSRSRQCGRSIVRCSVKAKTSSSRRRQRLTVEAPNLNSYSHDLLDELRRLIRSPSFISRVRERIQWPYFRFTGVLFGRVPVTQNDDGSGGDGVPDTLRHLANRVDMKFIDVPPLLVQRAATNTNQAMQIRLPRIVAVFETYGHPKKALLDLQNQRYEFEIDLQKQRVAWSDQGDTRRNETKIMSLHGAELFDDDYLGYYL